MTDILQEAGRQRTFPISPHPDAGKSSLTEKPLFADAIEEVGAVRWRAGRQRDVESDWTEPERQRPTDRPDLGPLEILDDLERLKVALRDYPQLRLEATLRV